MAQDDKAEDVEGAEGAAPKKSKMKLIIMAAAAVAVLGGGAGAYFMFFKKAPHDEHQAEAKAEVKPVAFLDVPEVLVNLAGMPGERVQYLKVKVVLELPDAHDTDKIKPVMPRVMDMFQTYLRELRPSDLSGSAGLFRLREELTRRVNAAVAPNHVNAVLFKEVVIQ